MDQDIGKACLTGDQQVRDLAAEIQELDLSHEKHRGELLWDSTEATQKASHPRLDFSTIVTIVDVAPDEDAQVQTVMARLAKRGDYDSLTAELAIATVGPDDTDAIVDFLDNLAIEKIECTTTACGKKLVQCVACEEQLPARDVILASCGHSYCGLCINMMFSAATTDESWHPPRCCQATQIPTKHARRFLDPELEATFKEKTIEFETVNRTYCSNPECSIFIPPSEVYRNIAYCSCWQETCVTCKAPAHSGDCPTDLELAEFLKYAKQSRWQRCYNCLSIVEKEGGCNHME
jgi:hypothetical protein